ncbi:hypothetical protein LJR016_000954 [Devosia sp. LjRoot16]|jgi:hypothetical protein|uniref:hypothetical protein n=1 Tax=Devosia sp. LjRoot16 TaxID=3342271 RepID=UPI003ECF29E3
MPDRIKDAIVSIATPHAASLEAWLLRHGFPVHHQSESADGAVTFYAVEDLSAEGREELREIGAEIVSEWKHGEPQDK